MGACCRNERNTQAVGFADDDDEQQSFSLSAMLRYNTVLDSLVGQLIYKENEGFVIRVMMIIDFLIPNSHDERGKKRS